MNIKNDYQPFSVFMYKMNRNEIQKQRQYLDENLSKRFIRANQSHTAFQVIFMKKANKKQQFSVDYCDLNSVTIKN